MTLPYIFVYLTSAASFQTSPVTYLMLFAVAHSPTRAKCAYRFSRHLQIDIIMSASLLLQTSVISLMNIINISGPNTLPCGIPLLT